MALIEVENLVKDFHRPRRYGGFMGGLRTLVTREQIVTRAVDHIDVTMEEGEFVGYLGPNGAGKSTTIKILTGILAPTSGRVEVAGAVPHRQREDNARRIGLVFGQRSQLWWDLPLLDSFHLIRRLYDIPAVTFAANLERFIDVLDLGGYLHTPVRQLSLGQRMRGDLVAAMLYEPRILYLDEPTIGLDTVAKDRIRDFVARLNRDEGTTVVLTTHDLDDVERLCGRIVLIDRGRVAYDGTTEELKANYAPYREVSFRLAGAPGFSSLETLLDIPGIEERRYDSGRVTLRFDPCRSRVTDVVGKVLAEYPVVDLAVTEPDLEGVLRRIYSAQEG